MRWGFAVAALLLISCGDDGDDGSADQGDGDAAVAVISDALVGGDDPNGLAFTAGEADCIARAVAERIGVERLREVGLDPSTGDAPDLHEPPLTAEEADVVYGAYSGCKDLVAAVADLLGPSLTGVDVRCAAQRYVDSGVLRESLFSVDFDPALNGRIDAAIADASAACATP